MALKPALLSLGLQLLWTSLTLGDHVTRLLSPSLATELPAIFWFGVLATSLCGRRTLQ